MIWPTLTTPDGAAYGRTREGKVELNRTTAWNEIYACDGFGNLTAKSFNGGESAVPGVNAATNQLTTGSFDLNGNMTSGFGGSFTYDVSNRMTTAVETGGGVEYYQYGADNKQVCRMKADGSEEFTF